ncbi:uncharacterized protein J7T54_001039 [Emericellopsis cladophorae]|uniref:Uncharacterized protein n=1 Tax=Emericellopsis cladophorae TaxID=2686198 RepID=A0A9P9XTY1_9HYPO|nr:uncharacterized protein J7T54_001039 [Emericellopsis cladophorae]KAI6777563.1 hypothetical protein J7T54_001039 [Emericellopsis cladophorae]
MTSSPSTIAQIPTISKLRHELDFAMGDKPQYDCHDFIDDLRSFRRVFRTAAGTEGRDLHQWKSRDHHLGLSEMVDAYLDRDGKGVKFWPDDPSKRYFSSSLQYTKDKSIIQQNLKLLLFRLNLQQYRNAKYKRAKQPKSGAHATRPGEPSNIDEAIRISAIWPTEEDVKPANLASQPFTISASGAAANKPPTDSYALPSSRESSQPLAQHRFRVVEAEKAQTSSQTTPDAHRAPKEPPAVHFTYRFVISREHPEKNEEWTPQGGFRDITLVRLMREMPLGFDTDFSGFQFTLWGPAVRVSHRVLNGQDAEFDAMKQKFEGSIISCMMEAQSGKTIDFELEVQPITPELQAAPAPAVHGLAAPQW